MNPRHAALAVDLFTGAVIASVAVALAGLTWRIVAGQGPAVAVPVPAVVAQSPVDLSPILAFAPFGRPSITDAPRTTLGVELRGIVLAEPASASTALIAPTGGMPEPVTVGGAVPGGATIEKIGLDHVLLRVGNRIERLDFPKAAQAAASAPAPAVAPAALPPVAVPSPAGGVDALVASLGAAPVANGWRLGESLSPQFRQAGLQPGDIVERINGRPLGDAQGDRQLLAAAALAGSVRADIVRNGRRITLSLPLR